MDDVLSDCEDIDETRQMTSEIWRTQKEEKKRIDSVSNDWGKVVDEPLQDHKAEEHSFSIECLNSIISAKH